MMTLIIIATKTYLLVPNNFTSFNNVNRYYKSKIGTALFNETMLKWRYHRLKLCINVGLCKIDSNIILIKEISPQFSMDAVPPLSQVM